MSTVPGRIVAQSPSASPASRGPGLAAGLADHPAAGIQLLRALHQRCRGRFPSRVVELTQAGKFLTTKGFSASLAYAALPMLYFVISYPLARLGNHLERRVGATRHSRPRRAL